MGNKKKTKKRQRKKNIKSFDWSLLSFKSHPWLKTVEFILTAVSVFGIFIGLFFEKEIVTYICSFFSILFILLLVAQPDWPKNFRRGVAVLLFIPTSTLLWITNGNLLNIPDLKANSIFLEETYDEKLEEAKKLINNGELHNAEQKLNNMIEKYTQMLGGEVNIQVGELYESLSEVYEKINTKNSNNKKKMSSFQSILIFGEICKFIENRTSYYFCTEKIDHFSEDQFSKLKEKGLSKEETSEVFLCIRQEYFDNAVEDLLKYDAEEIKTEQFKKYFCDKFDK